MAVGRDIVQEVLSWQLLSGVFRLCAVSRQLRLSNTCDLSVSSLSYWLRGRVCWLGQLWLYGGLRLQCRIKILELTAALELRLRHFFGTWHDEVIFLVCRVVIWAGRIVAR